MNWLERISWIWTQWRGHRLALVPLLLFNVANTATSIAYPLIFKYLIDFLFGAIGKGATTESKLLIYKIAGLVLIVGLLRFIAGFYPALRGIMNVIFEMKLRESYFAGILRKSAAFFQNFRCGDIVTRLSSDITEHPGVSWLLCSGIFRALDSLSRFLFCIVVMMTMSWKLSLLSIVPLPIMLIIYFILESRLGHAWKAYRDEVSNTGNELETCFSGVRTIKSYDRENVFSKRFTGMLEKRIGIELTAVKLNQITHIFYWMIGFTGQVIVITIGGWMVIQPGSAFTLGAFYAFYVYLGMLLPPLIDVLMFFISAKQSFVTINRLNEMKTFDAEGDLPEKFEIKTKLSTIESIEFRNVSFGYGKDRCDIDNISFRLIKGDIAVFFGKIGSGKSTLLKLILGLLRPTSGEILINGRDLRQIDLYDYWKLVGYIPQEPSLFSDTILENISMSRSVNETTAKELLKTVNMEQEVAKFQKGINSVLGLKGLTISGGQKQRISIARALAENPQMIILDDCTSSLDADNEDFIWKALDKVFQNRICLVVTHRIAAAKKAGKVFTLESGRLNVHG